MIFRRLIIAGILLTLFWGTSSVAQGEIKGARAKEIEAAFLLQFSKYVKWPDSAFVRPDDPIIVGILGRDPFGSVLDKIARLSKVKGRAVEILRFDNLNSIKNSHILFVTSSEVEHMADIKELLADKPVLLVGDSQNFLQFGIINFVMVDKKIRFNISRVNCEQSGLKISSKLLKVAHEVE